jgi:hypothetical protein
MREEVSHPRVDRGHMGTNGESAKRLHQNPSGARDRAQQF